MTIPSRDTASKRWFPSKLLVLITLYVATPSTALAPIALINCGSLVNYTDPNTGFVWSADAYFGNQGAKYTTNQPIANTDNDVVYQSERFFSNNNAPNPKIYDIPTTSTDVVVTLHFAELYFTEANKRIFDIYVEGSLVEASLDIVASTGGAYTATSLTTTATVTDGFVTIEFVKIKNNPKISGIEVWDGASVTVPTSAPTTSMAPTIAADYVALINCGSVVDYTDPNTGLTWEADNYNGGQGKKYETTNAISGTSMEFLYQTERFFAPWNAPSPPYVYEIPVGSLTTVGVVLHFAELFFELPGKRVFDVYVEGVMVWDNLDVYAETGGAFIAMDVGVEVPVTDGFVTIELAKVINNPTISGIEVYDGAVFTAPTMAPTLSMAPTAGLGYEALINCGGPEYVEPSTGRVWSADVFFTGGGTFGNGNAAIANTVFDPVYATERNGIFTYEIPLDIGSYEVKIHLAELYFDEAGARVFDLVVEDHTFTDIDVWTLAGGVKKSAFTLEIAQIVSDGFLTISSLSAFDQPNNPKISGIEVLLVGPHLAHAVVGGPYTAVDTDNTNSAVVSVDGSTSHTHGETLSLISWTWKEGATVLGTGAETSFSLPVGEHTISLTVEDDGGNDSTEETTVSILPFGYPAISSLSPDSGGMGGGNVVTINGSGFNDTAANTIVHFGLTDLTGDSLTIVDDFTITVVAPAEVVGVAVAVTVETPLATSNAGSYTYIAGVPIAFTSNELATLIKPTVVKFGPDGHLYVGSTKGQLSRFVLNDDHTAVLSQVSKTVSAFRPILGIAFDPLDTSLHPAVFITTNNFFHGEANSSSGEAINGDVRKVTGANLDIVEMIITGLPVSDHDHGSNALVMGDNGELYIAIGSNTNGGIPGQLSGTQLQKENYYSAATLRANLADPLFDGTITYDAPDEGSPNGGYGIDVFAHGLRNPFGMCLHSNGKLYSTDNGPNLGYGDMMTGCGPTDFVPDVKTPDRLNILEEGHYYGHPNPQRAADLSEPRQCVWKDPYQLSDADYTAPILVLESSSDAIVEWKSEHFDGQLRGNLIVAKYTDPLYRVILAPDGNSVIAQSDPALELVGDGTLGVEQAPSGTLIDCRPGLNSIYAHKPVEPASSDVVAKSVFPVRGSVAGGNTMTIYGINLDANGAPTVTVGGSACPVTSSSANIVKCTLPGGTGTVDIVVTSGVETSTFSAGYRYITGLPA